MSDSENSEWTLNTLARFLDARIDAAGELSRQRHESAAQALEVALTASERRFDNVNEFRAQLGDQQRTFIPRVEVEKSFLAIDDRLKKLEAADQETHGHGSGIKDGWGWAVGGIMFVIALGSFLLTVFNRK